MVSNPQMKVNGKVSLVEGKRPLTLEKAVRM